VTGLRNRVSSLGSSESVVLCILCLGVFSTALDQTVVVAALPGVMLDLEIPLTELDRASWIVTAYLVAYTVAMPLGGRLSDVHGRVRMFQAALVVFSVGSAFVALAPNFGWIVSARVVQAIGGGATVPIGLAMAVAAVSARRRGIAIGLVAAAAEAGSVLGPLYGGAIIELLGWRWIFWLDIPQSFILIALLALLPDRANPEAKMDYLGAIVMGGALIFLTAGLSQRSLFSATSVYPYLLVATGALLANTSNGAVRALSHYGHNIGIAFQLIDDALDYCSEENKFGKKTGQDLAERKMTLPLYYSIENAPEDVRRKVIETLDKEDDLDSSEIAEISQLVAHYRGVDLTRKRAKEFVVEAKKSLDEIPQNDYKESLGRLADYVAERNF